MIVTNPITIGSILFHLSLYIDRSFYNGGITGRWRYNGDSDFVEMKDQLN